MGGDLATLDTMHEIIWMRGYRSYHKALRVDSWIGGHLNNGTWEWMGKQANTPIIYTDWSVNQPDGSGLCMSLFTEQSGATGSHNVWYKFDDDFCTKKHAYICEMPQQFNEL